MKISIIVPIYNSSEFLDRCVKSVLMQSIPSWELILVDDGSQDNSFDLMQAYAADDDRIKIIHQDNAGPGIARNTGLSCAEGEYIVFLDSDDYIAPNYIQLLSQHNEDVVFIDVQAVDENGKVLRNEFLSKYKTMPKDDFLRSQMTGKINWGGVRKASKRKLLDDYNIRYSDHQIGEEACFSFQLIYHAKSISFINTPIYFYIQRNNSQSHLKMDDPWGKVAIMIRDIIINLNCYKKYADTCNAFVFTAAAVSADRLVLNYDKKNYSRKIKELYASYEASIDHSFSIDYLHMSIKAMLIGGLLKYRMFNTIWIMCKLKHNLL